MNQDTEHLRALASEAIFASDDGTLLMAASALVRAADYIDRVRDLLTEARDDIASAYSDPMIVGRINDALAETVR